jgi:hypothetical protein
MTDHRPTAHPANLQPAGASTVTTANWYWGPGNRWAYRNMRRLFPTARIARGKGPVTPLPVKTRHVDDIQFLDPVSGRKMTVGEMYGATHTDAFLVLKDGAIVVERYFNGMQPDDQHLLMSVSKSVAGSLTGLAVERGQLDLDRLVTAYLPELIGTVYDGATLRHALDMQIAMEFDYDETSSSSDIHRMDESVGWVPPGPHACKGIKAFLRTLTRKKGHHGEVFDYLTQQTSILTWCLERATGEEFAALLQRDIWEKLGAEEDAALVLDACQDGYTPPGLNMTLRDLGRFGQMMLQNGVYNGQRIVPEEWIQDIRHGGSKAAWAKAERNRARDQMVGFAEGAYRSYWYVADESCGRYMGLGLGGQMLVIDPVANMVAVKFTSSPTLNDGETAFITQYYAIAAIIAALAGGS